MLKDRLSARQTECLELVARGYTSKEIAREIGISPSTVDNHINTAVDRLDARNRADAARLIAFKSMEVDKGGPLLDLLDRQASEEEKALIELRQKPFSYFSLPPLGGRKNMLTSGQRIYHMCQIALLSILFASAAILTIAGVVHVIE